MSGSFAFTLSLGENKVKGCWVTVPKPIVEVLGTPEKVSFSVKGRGKIEVEPAKDE